MSEPETRLSQPPGPTQSKTADTTDIIVVSYRRNYRRSLSRSMTEKPLTHAKNGRCTAETSAYLSYS